MKMPEKRVKRVGKRFIYQSADGMKIWVSPLFFVMLLAFVFLGRGYECVCYFTTVILHECTHAAVSKRLGYTLSEFRLNPYGASLYGAFEGAKWQHELLIAVVGPVCNFVLALIVTAVWWVAPAVYSFTNEFVNANLALGIFNLLPIYPLDGGRAVLAILSIKSKRARAYKVLRIFGFILGGTLLGFFIVSLFFSPNLSFLTAGIFIITSALIPDKKIVYSSLYDYAYRKESLKHAHKIKVMAVSHDAPLIELNRQLNPNYFCRFEILDDNLNSYAVIDENQLIRLESRFAPHIAIKATLYQKRKDVT